MHRDHPVYGLEHSSDLPPGIDTSGVLASSEKGYAGCDAERSAPRHALGFYRGGGRTSAKLPVRTSDISCTGCYIDTLNPIPQGSQVRVRILHHEEIFEAVGRVV
jgi:hypothetical protein